MERGSPEERLYGRYTAFCLDASDDVESYDRDRVLDFWEKVGVPSASEQEGWRRLMIVESTEAVGRLRTITLWESKAAFDCYYAAQTHQGIVKTLAEMGLRIDDRDGFEVLFEARRRGSILRFIRSNVQPGRAEEIAEFWRSTGGPLIRRQAGCIDADAYWGPERSVFILAVEWRSLADVERFMASEEHQEFVDGLGDAVIEIVDRQTLERIA